MAKEDKKDNVVYTQRTVNEYLIRWDGNSQAFPDQWMSLDGMKYTMQKAEEGGEPFWVTLHYEQKHPDFLLKPKDFAQQNMRWKPGTRVRMFFDEEDHPDGGEYYTGQVVEHDADAADPWNSVHVKWDAQEDGDEEHDWVCPWELLVAHAADSVKQGNMVVRNAAEAARIPRGGVYLCTDDDSPLSIAQKRSLDVELIVLLNKEELKGLTKYSKLVNGTKVKLPPKGYRYQRSGGTVIHTSVDGTAELQFPKEDEVFWEGAWTENIRKVADTVLKKITKQRGIGPFLTPVDWEARGLNDYPTIVSEPMDLGTVESRFHGTDGEDEYPMPKDFYRCLRLVFENSKRYNPEGSDLHRKAVEFLNLFEDSWRVERSKLEEAEKEELMRKRKAFDKESAYKRKKMLQALGNMGTPGTPPNPNLIAAQLGLQPLAANPNLLAQLGGMSPASFAMAMGGAAGDSDRRSTVSCGICGGDGHNRRTCPHAPTAAASAVPAPDASAASTSNPL